MAIAGILLLVLPEDTLVKQENLKPNETKKEAVKKIRNYGIILLVIAVVLLIFQLI